MGRLSPFARYAVAGLLTVMALSLALVGQDTWGSAATYSFFLGAVMLSSWVGGLGPGIMATVLSTLAADYFLIPPVLRKNSVRRAWLPLPPGLRLANCTLRGSSPTRFLLILVDRRAWSLTQPF